MSDNSRFTSIFLLIVLALIWGTSFILMKRGLLVFSPDEVGALRVTAACVVLLPFAFSNLKALPKTQYWKPFYRVCWAYSFRHFCLLQLKPEWKVLLRAC